MENYFLTQVDTRWNKWWIITSKCGFCSLYTLTSLSVKKMRIWKLKRWGSYCYDANLTLDFWWLLYRQYTKGVGIRPRILLGHSVSINFPCNSFFASPNKAVSFLMEIFSSSCIQLLTYTTQSVPTTTSATSKYMLPHSFPISLFRSWYIFLIPSWSCGEAIYTSTIIIPLLLSFSTTTDFLTLTTWLHLMIVSTSPCSWCSYHFLILLMLYCLQQNFQLTSLATLSCLLSYSFFFV